MDLSIILDKIEWHYVYIKDFNKFMFNKTKHKNKIYFCKYCLQYFSSESILVKHKNICLKKGFLYKWFLHKNIKITFFAVLLTNLFASYNL